MFKALFAMGDSEHFKNRWSGVQSIFTCLGIIFAGLWTTLTFWGLGQANRARAEVQKLERDNAVQGVINLQVHAWQPEPRGDKNRYIAVAVTAQNVGQKNVKMCFEEPIEGKDSQRLVSRCELNPEGKQQPEHLPPLNVSRVLVDQASGEIKFGKPILGEVYRPDVTLNPDVPLKILNGLYVRVGQTESYTGLLRVPEAGLYRVSFSVRLPKAETESTSVPLSIKPVWGADEFFVIK